MKSVPHIPRFIYLYDGTDVENFDIPEIKDYLGQWFKPDHVQIRGEFVQHNLRGQEERLNAVAEAVAKARIIDPVKPIEADSRGSEEGDILYDGLALQKVYCELIQREESSLDNLHIAFTDRLIGTWDDSDRRYHARVSIYGWPNIISTTGIVEAPAKPREYYFGLMAGVDEKLLQEELSGRFIDYGDARLTELLKGYTMQAVFYHLSAEPFCDNPDCRGFNAHWQEEMIRAQLKGPEGFCDKHREMLREIRGHRERA